MLRSSSAALLAAATALAACAPSSSPTEWLQAAPQDAAQQELQGRRFEGIEEKRLLDASVAVLQDLGFAVEITGTALGFVQGAKEREAKAPGQVAVVILSALGGAPMVGGPPGSGLRQDQTIRVLLTVRPAGAKNPASHIVMVSFHRHVRQPLAHSAETLRDPALYQGFFELLSKAVFLEGHKL